MNTVLTLTEQTRACPPEEKTAEGGFDRGLENQAWQRQKGIDYPTSLPVQELGDIKCN